MAVKKEQALVKVNCDLMLPQDLIPELEQARPCKRLARGTG